MSNTPERVARSQVVLADAISFAAKWIAGGAGLVLLAIAAVIGHIDVASVGVIGVVVGLVGFYQRRRARNRPLVILAVVSTAYAAAVPLLDPAVSVLSLPVFTLLAFVGVFSFSRPTALWFGIWCGALVIWGAWWTVPNAGGQELLVGVVMVSAIGVSGWRLLSLVRNVAIEEEENYRRLFDASPVAMFEEDFSDVAERLATLRAGGIRDLRSHLADHPDETIRLISAIRIRRTNAAANLIVGAGSEEDLADAFVRVERQPSELASFSEQFVAIWEGRKEVALDLEGVAFDGRAFEAVLHWSVPTIRGRRDLSRVIVAISDIEPRKVVEDRLAEALETNERLLAFEKALAACSRALLFGTGDDALDVALGTLRDAIGADRSYLVINTDDPQLGLCFRVVHSVSRADIEDDEWVDRVIPWSKYPDTRDALSRGEPFHHLAAEGSEKGWRRSLLTVPVFASGRWLGSVGFVDVHRRTDWGSQAVRTLEVAAPMLGTFWEREVTRRRLEEMVRSKDQFLASVSHELRTPLAAVLGFAEELRERSNSFGPEELAEILALIVDQSQDMTDMVEDLLVAARADIGTISIRPQDVYLRSQVEAALASLGPDSLSTVEVVGGPGRAWADPTRTRQIIRNLLTNALRYGGDEVVVSAESDDDVTLLTVWDNGAGLDAVEWERIFEPYERAHDRPSQPSSIGLGLTVSRQLARLMGGELNYRADDRGSVFELRLPSGPESEPTLYPEMQRERVG